MMPFRRLAPPDASCHFAIDDDSISPLLRAIIERFAAAAADTTPLFAAFRHADAAAATLFSPPQISRFRLMPLSLIRRHYAAAAPLVY
jgi:hypothetical protein